MAPDYHGVELLNFVLSGLIFFMKKKMKSEDPSDLTANFLEKGFPSHSIC